MKIIATGLEQTYVKKELFGGLSFEVNSGDFLVIHGPSGSGKSTLLNLISGLEKPHKGKVEILDNSSSEIDPYNRLFRRDHLNYMFQNFALLEDETVEYNLKIPLLEKKYKKDVQLALMQESLDKVGLKNILKTKVATLSGGEQQRVAIARVFLKSGDLIIADEPTGNLDEENAKIIINLLKGLQVEGKIVIVVTHNPNFLSYATKIIKI
ncbi:ATP-binding cassette domain-containing protein [Listeria booriae]|uniref:ATP-binding cassette domain-containing protein n=1 Tax=Listeria booriae TaxID=1552123 RepID=UPI001C8ABA72|nr:ATP-binding cassette domain-containing protein [Listeria booriae]